VATAQPPARLFDDSFLKYLPAPLREPQRAWLAIIVGWALSIAGSVALASLGQLVAPQLPSPAIPKLPVGLLIFMFVAFAPFVETLIMAGVLTLLLRFVRPTTAVLVSAAGWGVAHSAEALGWGIVIWWPFLIFSTLFVVWRQRGFWAGVGVAAATHALQNLGPAIALALR
jgi:hypothetical protein